VADTITGLLVQRRGHFKMESGYHSAAWFELGSLFDHPDDLSPFVTELARRLASHGVDSVCGPMTGGAKLARLIARELRIECFEAERLETPGTEQFAANRGLALEAIQRMPLEMWGPAECPLCKAGVAIDPVSAG